MRVRAQRDPAKNIRHLEEHDRAAILYLDEKHFMTFVLARMAGQAVPAV